MGKIKNKYCVGCGVEKGLTKYTKAYFKPNVKFEECYVCKKCKKTRP